jgi:hypothetical protein
MIEIPSFVQDRKDLENNSFQQKILFVESVLGTGVKIAKILWKYDPNKSKISDTVQYF